MNQAFYFTQTNAFPQSKIQWAPVLVEHNPKPPINLETGVFKVVWAVMGRGRIGDGFAEVTGAS